jgi:hypothetical protein
LGLKIGIFCGDNEDVCTPGCTQSFPEISGGEQVVVPIGAADEKNIDVPVELAMLETVVENVDRGWVFRG